MKAYKIKLNHIVWEFDFLVHYKASSDDETLLVTTIKNKIRAGKEDFGKQKKSKKTRRIKWQDQQRPTSAFSITSSKSIPKNNVIKGRLMSPTPMQFSRSSAPQ